MSPRAESFEPLPEAALQRWDGFGKWDERYFPNVVGMVVEELRRDYARMRVPWAPHLRQPTGVLHGGVVASLIDTVVVPAVGSAYDTDIPMATISMTVQYLAPVRGEDAIAEGWVERRGRSVVFCRAEVQTSSGDVAATASLVYKVSPGRG